MSANSKIAWTTNTFNIAWGCNEASPGCDHCYAKVLAKRYGHDVWGPNAKRRTMSAEYWAQPLKWERRAAKSGQRERVFCSSMTDVFLNDPTINHEREKLWPLIAATPHLDWQILTKHPERFRHAMPGGLIWSPAHNLWLGVSIENNDYAWRADMFRVTPAPAAVRFLSLEPLLGPVDAVNLEGIHWVIVGGESGPHHRPMDLQWARDVRDRCKAAGIAYFFKQVGALHPSDEMIPADLRIREFPA